MTEEERESALHEIRGIINEWPQWKLAQDLFEAYGFTGMTDSELQKELEWYQDYNKRNVL